jgi:hypothetical protein
MDLGAILNKIKDNILLIKEEKFDTLAKDPGYMDSFTYLIVCMAIYSIISFPVMLLSSTVQGILNSGSSGVAVGAGIGMVGAFLQIAFFFVIGIPLRYVFFGIQHILLKLVGGTGTFLQTVQVMIYGSTPGNVLGWIPCVGWVFDLVSLVNILLGAKRVHNLSLLKAILAVIVIPILLAIAIIAIIVVFFASSIALLGGMFGGLQ